MKRSILTILALAFLAVPSGRTTAQTTSNVSNWTCYECSKVTAQERLAICAATRCAPSPKITILELSADFLALAIKIENSELNRADRDNYAGLMGYLGRTITSKLSEDGK